MTNTTKPTPPECNPNATAFGASTDDLYEVLLSLGHDDNSVVSVCTRAPGEMFQGRTERVVDLAVWSPPPDRNVYFSPNPLTLHPGVTRKGGVADVARGRYYIPALATLELPPGGTTYDIPSQC